MIKKLLAILVIYTSFMGFSYLSHPQPAVAQSDNSNVVVESIPGSTVAEKFTSRTKSSWPWYVARGSGLIAAISLVILLLSGIGLVTGYTFRFLEPLTAWASHRALGIVFGISVLLHMFSLMFDHFIPFSFLELLVPWLSDYKPATIFGIELGSLYVALGVLAFYGAFVVVLTSLLWVEKKPYVWKLIHLLSYLVMLFVFVHALYLGTDLMHGVWRYIWIISGFSISIAVLHRLWRAKTI